MKAIILENFGGPEVMGIGEVESPLPGDNDVLVKVKATSVNRADIIQRQGHYPPPEGESEILGLEVAGVVEKTGARVKNRSIGDRVMGLVPGGGYAQYVAVHKDHLIPVPENMSFEEAACVCEVYITAFLNVFVIGRLKHTETVLLHGGGGGVNTAAIQLCRNLVPESRIIVTASGAKISRVYELGASHVINYREEDFASVVRALTDNHGADLILDHIGAAYFQSNLKALAVEGRLVIIGLMGGSMADINLGLLMVKRQHVIGSVLRSRTVREKALIIRDFRKQLMPLFRSRRIVPVIHKVFPITQVQKAHEEMEKSLHFGKIVLTWQMS